MGQGKPTRLVVQKCDGLLREPVRVPNRNRDRRFWSPLSDVSHGGTNGGNPNHRGFQHDQRTRFVT